MTVPDRQIRLPALPSLVLAPRAAIWLGPDGELEEIGHDEAARRLRAGPCLVAHARSIARRLRLDGFEAVDVLELFAFVRPAAFCLPTPRGLAQALLLALPEDHEDEALVLRDAAAALLGELSERSRDPSARPIAETMRNCGWAWGETVLYALGASELPPPGAVRPSGLQVWRRLEEWSEHAPEPPAGNKPVTEEEARGRLKDLLGGDAEARPSQADYASAAAFAFAPRDEERRPNVVLAEAGTGVGKTLGYIAPASVWAEKNEGAVWVSTYTRNLQHQIDGELDRLYPDPVRKALKAVVRKGRENYLCLLNLEEAVNTLPTMPQYGTALGLMARWAEATRDGDVQGGDFPAWLADLLGRGRTVGLADRRGECIYSACPHYSKCYIEKSIRRARRAEIVVANHALVMIQAALGGIDDGALPTRYVFDEGHHVFDAADSAFSAHLTAIETVELRRWLIGAEGRRSGRARGLKKRVEDLIADDEEALEALEAALHAARVLPGEGWMTRIAEGETRGETERFLALVRAQVYARTDHPDSPYSMQTETHPPVEGLLEAAEALDAALARILTPIKQLKKRLEDRLDADADELESAIRLRIEAVARSLQRRGEMTLGAWRDMLKALAHDTPEAFTDWFEIERSDGRDMDIGLHRHWIDPGRPFAETVVKQAQGVLMTSATLRDGTGEEFRDWQAAEERTGAVWLEAPAVRAAVASPFDYPAQTKVFIVNDVRKDDMAQVAAAYRELFLASGGGALGLFTAIQRLREVHRRIGGDIDEADLPLYAQHVDGLDLTTLIDIFRAEENACLLGTDAVRDGVDVPGNSLRLIVFDRVPWPRPDILYKARRSAFGGGTYTDMLTRLKLKQAFGRLVRRADDRGVFVLLDPMMPSRLLGAFPEGVEVRRCGLAEAVAETRGFFGTAPVPAEPIDADEVPF
ncbi:ATP-dependent DNA helicase [Nisaea acidiphila]|uniref:ATP-dependent DNA helicase n=1 Tax=Nisaea acidiphila TaxID=1862145 RepID=A0A9J7AYJ2_9PROT|nr:ATP-dependent DNA helicase [Nisaea acidiphila]UUX51340.1 ATP-dependent DNA helicase [Nisaea acidiphila]